MAFFKNKHAEFSQIFPEVKDLTVSAYRSPGSGEVRFGLYGSAGTRSVSGHSETLAEAAKKLRADIGSPEDAAAKLRERAAAMLAEANELSPSI